MDMNININICIDINIQSTLSLNIMLVFTKLIVSKLVIKVNVQCMAYDIQEL